MRVQSIVPFVLAVMLLLTGCASDIRAEQANGTDYTGTHEAGGIIRLTLSAEGDRVIAMDASGIAGGGCTWDTIDLSNWGISVPVTDGTFAAVNADGDQFSGRLTDQGHAEGTIQLNDPAKGCETPPLRWVAQAEQ
jgi:hypothetical protein